MWVRTDLSLVLMQQLQDKVIALNEMHGSELHIMRQKLNQLTSDLHHRDPNSIIASEKSSNRTIHDESDIVDKKMTEFKVGTLFLLKHLLNFISKFSMYISSIYEFQP